MHQTGIVDKIQKKWISQTMAMSQNFTKSLGFDTLYSIFIFLAMASVASLLILLFEYFCKIPKQQFAKKRKSK